MKRAFWTLAALAALLVVAVATVVSLNLRGEDALPAAPQPFEHAGVSGHT